MLAEAVAAVCSETYFWWGGVSYIVGWKPRKSRGRAFFSLFVAPFVFLRADLVVVFVAQ
jgi:hypothetical protein